MHASHRRSTRQRQAIVEVVRALDDHPTAEHVFFEVRKRLPTISLGTVYRNLNLLAEQGIIAEFSMSENARRYDGNTGRHSHIICTVCGAIRDIWPPDGPTERIVAFAEAATGYCVERHHVELFGVCPDCREGTEGTPSDSRAR